MKKLPTFQDLTAGMKPGEQIILTLLLSRRDTDLATRISQKELAGFIGRSPGTVNNYIRQLSEAGHIRKLTGPIKGDDRSVFTFGYAATRRWNTQVRAAL